MVLVSVVGDFFSSVLPLFYEYKNEINRHIIVYDDFKNDALFAKKMIRGTKKFIQKNNLPIETVVIQLDEDSLEAVEKLSQTIASYTNDFEKLYLNITDGLANIGIILSDAFKPKGAKILTYDRYDNEYNILTKNSMQTVKIKSCVPIREHFLLKDVEILSFENSEFAIKYEKEINIFFQKYEADRETFAQKYTKENCLSTVATGFLYEYFIYNLVKKLNYDDILAGVKVKDHRDLDEYLLNEYDILIMKDNHLHMIECKYLKTLDVTALIYKLDSVRETLDEDSKLMIVAGFDTYDELVKKPEKEPPLYYKRASVKKIALRGNPLLHLQDFLKDVDDIFALNTENLEKICEMQERFASIKIIERIKLKAEIRNYLETILLCKRDFFDAKEILQLLQYNTNKNISNATKDVLKNMACVVELLKLINKMLSSKKEYISIYDVYKFYIQNCRTN